MTVKLMAHAFCGALVAFLFGLCGGHTFLKHLDKVYSPGMVIAGKWASIRALLDTASPQAIRNERSFATRLAAIPVVVRVLRYDFRCLWAPGGGR